MTRTLLHLTDEQDQRLQQLARARGRTRGELLREAVERLLDEAPADEWKARLREARGMWRGRSDLDGVVAEARRGFDRDLTGA